MKIKISINLLSISYNNHNLIPFYCSCSYSCSYSFAFFCFFISKRKFISIYPMHSDKLIHHGFNHDDVYKPIIHTMIGRIVNTIYDLKETTIQNCTHIYSFFISKKKEYSNSNSDSDHYDKFDNSC